MNVLVVGWIPDTASDGASEEKRTAFVNACREIGMACARNRHSVVVRYDDKESADRFIVEGMNDVDGRHRVMVQRSDHGPTAFANDRERLSRIDFVYFSSGSSWAARRIDQIQKSDVVLLIGGARDAEQVAYMAPALGKPVLPVGAFGGKAADIVDLLDSDFRHADLSEMVQLLKDGNPSAQTIVDDLEKLRRRNPFRVRRGVGYYALPAVAIAVVAFWEWMYARWTDSQGRHEVGLLFALLEASAVAGAGLRLLTQLVSGDLQEIDFALVMNSFAISLLLAWGLGLVYVAVGQDISGSGQAPLLTVEHLGIRMGLIGLIAGFVTESGIEGLKRFLDRMTASFTGKGGG